MVTGPAGAGRTTAIRALEDIGFEAIDNLPLRLLPALLANAPARRPIALGVDPRNRDFSAQGLADAMEELSRHAELQPQILYLDCRADVLLRRFSETRRRHPMAPAETPSDGIAREFDLLEPIRSSADILIDTSELTPHDLRAEVERLFAGRDGAPLALSVHSFSYKRGMPRGLDMVFDVRFLRNPYWVPELRGLNGTSQAVQAHVAGDPRYDDFLSRVTDLTVSLLPAYRAEGKAHLGIGFGCTGGQHRSVTLAETLGAALAQAGWQVSIRHRELERRRSGGAA
ncbi:RNase adapter RapZ [Pseudooceanicola aestuarii]|uniref:RNase adapter RapZ n=1 Tax=Pseudooceanicola aestuarii TaxID=2697319 RepID=UPI0013D30514|nr:RNase adapter RapZ [Pseudooceanicola aestuarii]